MTEPTKETNYLVNPNVCNHGKGQEFLATDKTGIRCGQCFYDGYVTAVNEREALLAENESVKGELSNLKTEYAKMLFDLDGIHAERDRLLEFTKGGCPHACTDGNCPFDRKARAIAQVKQP